MSNSYKPVITMTLHKRPRYTQEVLLSLSQCTGIEKYLLIISVDGNNSAVLNLAYGFDACDTRVIHNVKALGCGANTGFVLGKGFEETDYVIHIEDDTVPAMDMLRYMEWACQFETDQNCFSISAYNYTTTKHNLADVWRVSRFMPWGWSTWTSRWEEMKTRWSPAWDVNLHFKIRGNRYVMMPAVSRTQNIGAVQGMHVCPTYHAQHHHTPIVASQYPEFTGEYVLLDGIQAYVDIDKTADKYMAGLIR